MIDLRISDDPTPRNLDMAFDLLRGGEGANKDYPGHDGWVEVTIENMRLGLGKVALIASYNGVPMALVIYQRHPDMPNMVEVKNMTLTPQLIRSNLPGLPGLLLQTLDKSVTDTYPETQTLVADTKASNARVIRLAEQNGWEVAATTMLVGSGKFGHNGKPDVVLTKDVRSQTPSKREKTTPFGFVIPRP